MASITIRNLDNEVKTKLRVRAAGNGRSMEEEARIILRQAVGPQAEFQQPREHHPCALRTFQGGGSGIAGTRGRPRATVL